VIGVGVSENLGGESTLDLARGGVARADVTAETAHVFLLPARADVDAADENDARRARDRGRGGARDARGDRLGAGGGAHVDGRGTARSDDAAATRTEKSFVRFLCIWRVVTQEEGVLEKVDFPLSRTRSRSILGESPKRRVMNPRDIDRHVPRVVERIFRKRRRRHRDATRARETNENMRARVLFLVVAFVVVSSASSVSAVDGNALDSVASRARTVRVYGVEGDDDDDDRASRGGARTSSASSSVSSAYEYEYEYGDEAWMDETWWREFETADSGRRRGTDPSAAPRTFDEYVELEVAKLEVSLLEQSTGTDADREAIRRTLDDIAYDIQADLERVAQTRASEMTYRGDFAPAYHPPPDFVAYQNDAYVIYDADGSRVMFEPQGEIGRLMQQLTWFTTIFPGNPTALDDYMRCATLVRPCSVEEVLRKCTYEPRGTWYRERISRMNAPLTWSYCQPDLEQVYEYCTPIEVQSGLCDPRRARERMYLSQTVAINGGVAPCLRWRTNIFGTRECIDRGLR